MSNEQRQARVRKRHAKIVATLGPATSSADAIEDLFRHGADVFRLNFSHGSHADHQRRLETIRQIEQRNGRPIGVMLDLQGPKLRVGRFAEGSVDLQRGAAFRLDLDDAPGDGKRVTLPHPELFEVLRPGTDLLVNDGKIRLKTTGQGEGYVNTQVVNGGTISDSKGVNVPGVVLPISALTDKDREDLAFGLELGVDWVALSFVQRPDDIAELKEIVGDRASVICKLEKPAALECLDEIVALTDGVMVARGDLGVELPPEDVPGIQKRIVSTCRRVGKPVVVATQMLESMISAPTPTRAEASDVATAVFDGADAVMLSGETAVGEYPNETVGIMHRIIAKTERADQYRRILEAEHAEAVDDPNISDAICASLRWCARLLSVAATVTYTNHGATSLRAARERPEAPILSLTPHIATARRLAIVWGVHAVTTENFDNADDMVENAQRTAVREGFAEPGQILAITAGMPLGYASSTNLLRLATVE